MKEGIHPENYRTVIFKDLTADWRFLGKSCAESKETEQWDDGNEYPVIKVEVSSASHPFYTGKLKYVDTAGRIEKFQSKFAAGLQKPMKPLMTSFAVVLIALPCSAE